MKKLQVPGGRDPKGDRKNLKNKLKKFTSVAGAQKRYVLPLRLPKSESDSSVIYYIKSSVVALFSVKPMFSVKLVSVKAMQYCTFFD